MYKKKVISVKRPNAFLYYAIGFIAGLYFRWFLGLQINRSAIKGLKAPFFVLAGHTSWLDFLTVSLALFPHRMNYLAAYNFFRYPVFRYFFGLLGVIPKYQFTGDSQAILKTKRVIGKGGIITIFPHGCLSNEGRPGGFAAQSTAKLLKTFKIPVVVVQIDGGYLSRPRWTKSVRRGQMEARVIPLFTPHELAVFTVDEIYIRLLAAIHFDDYQWQRKKMITFRGKNLTEGAELVLYKCPKCKDEFSLRTNGNKIYCQTCHNAAYLNNKLFFEPENKESVIYDGFDTWYDFQQENLLTEIRKPNFLMSTPATLQWNEPGKNGYQLMGHGKLCLTLEALTYEGTIFGKHEMLRFDMNDIIMVPFAAGEYFEIAKGEDIRRFVTDDLRVMMKWVLAIRLIRDEYYEKKSET